MRVHHHRLETWLEEELGRFGTRPVLFIYFFLSFSPSPPPSAYPQESSPLFILELGARVPPTNFVTTMETTPRFENVAQICLLLLPSSFPHNL